MTENRKAIEMDTKIIRARPRAIALAALYICESLLLELEARDIVHKKDVEGLLKDAAKTLRAANGLSDHSDLVTVTGEASENADAVAASDIVDIIREQHEKLND